MRALLPERQIESEHDKAQPLECRRHRDQHRGLVVSSGAMCQHKPVSGAALGEMKHALNNAIADG